MTTFGSLICSVISIFLGFASWGAGMRLSDYGRMRHGGVCLVLGAIIGLHRPFAAVPVGD